MSDYGIFIDRGANVAVFWHDGRERIWVCSIDPDDVSITEWAADDDSAAGYIEMRESVIQQIRQADGMTEECDEQENERHH